MKINLGFKMYKKYKILFEPYVLFSRKLSKCVMIVAREDCANPLWQISVYVMYLYIFLI